MNNKLLYAILAIFGFSIIGLYILYFTNSKNNKLSSNTHLTQSASDNDTSNYANDTSKIEFADSSELGNYLEIDNNLKSHNVKIAFVLADSIDEKLKMMKKVKAQIESQVNSKRNLLIQKEKEYQSKLERMGLDIENKRKQYAMNAATLTDAQSKQKTDEINSLLENFQLTQQQLNQNFSQLQQKYELEISEIQSKEMDSYYSQVQKYSEYIAKNYGFDYVIIKREKGDLLYSNKAFDLTTYIINAMNKEFDEMNK